MFKFLTRFSRIRPPKQIEISAIVLHNANDDLSVTILAPDADPQIIPPLTNGIAPLSHFLSNDGKIHITIGKVIETHDTLGDHVEQLRAEQRAGRLDAPATTSRLPKSVKE